MMWTEIWKSDEIGNMLHLYGAICVLWGERTATAERPKHWPEKDRHSTERSARHGCGVWWL